MSHEHKYPVNNYNRAFLLGVVLNAFFVVINGGYGVVAGSLASAILLLIALGGITWEAIGRFLNPKPVEEMTVIVVVGIGVIVNTITALLFVSGQKNDLNIRGAFLHIVADAGVSFGVVVAGKKEFF